MAQRPDDLRGPTFGSLFAGIGGFDLGLERAGWVGRWQVESDPFCQRVLASHWPEVTRYGAVEEVDWSTVEPVDLIAGGFPCQPFSLAGKQLRQSDPRWLWPEFARAVRALRPRYVLVENVTGLLVGSGLGDVLGDLAALGYDAEWGVIPASAVGAPHRRERVWIVAHPHRDDQPWGDDGDDRRGAAAPELRPESGRRGAGPRTLADAHPGGREGRAGGRRSAGRAEPSDGGPALADADESGLEGHRRQHRVRGRPRKRLAGSRRRSLDGWWRTEPNVGRVAYGVPARVDRLRTLGNAVVPQVATLIGGWLMTDYRQDCPGE